MLYAQFSTTKSTYENFLKAHMNLKQYKILLNENTQNLLGSSLSFYVYRVGSTVGAGTGSYFLGNFFLFGGSFFILCIAKICAVVIILQVLYTSNKKSAGHQ
jgi:hypothetical protein